MPECPARTLSARIFWANPCHCRGSHSKLIVIITDLHFDAAEKSVCESNPNQIAGEPADLLTKHQRQWHPLIIDVHAEARRMPLQFLCGCTVAARGLKQFGKIARSG
jgi:hypothetical protein